ncbi:MAG TPA: hypothetical protein VHK89_06275, partial [Actinomycetota bacterium]|nr:hypothetical protein [Actinomycetota bacterium]
MAEPALAVLGSLAHGAPPPPPGSGARAAWPFEPLLWASCLAAIAMYLRAAAHEAHSSGSNGHAAPSTRVGRAVGERAEDGERRLSHRRA